MLILAGVFGLVDFIDSRFLHLPKLIWTRKDGTHSLPCLGLPNIKFSNYIFDSYCRASAVIAITGPILFGCVTPLPEEWIHSERNEAPLTIADDSLTTNKTDDSFIGNLVDEGKDSAKYLSDAQLIQAIKDSDHTQGAKDDLWLAIRADMRLKPPHLRETCKARNTLAAEASGILGPFSAQDAALPSSYSFAGPRKGLAGRIDLAAGSWDRFGSLCFFALRRE